MKNYPTLVNMDSKYIVSETNPVSANDSTETMESRQSYKEPLICRNNPKPQLQEIEENVRAAESYYDSTMQIRLSQMKSQYRTNWQSKNDGTISRKTSSLYNSFKMALSDDLNEKVSAENNINNYLENDFNNDEENDFKNHQENDFNNDQENDLKNHQENDLKNHQENDFDYLQENHEMIDDKEDISQVEVVLTPRSNKRNSESIEEIIPNLDYIAESLESIKTNTGMKKTSKLKKKSHIIRLNDEAGKVPTPSLISKTKRKKFHGRLKNSNSKSTIATRDTNFSDKKVDKRKFKRQKSLNTIGAIQSPPVRKRVNSVKARESKLLNKKEFVEIYHNTALKSGSLSIVSSKQSKITPAPFSHLSKEATDAVGDTKKRKKFPKIEQVLHIEPQIYVKPVDHEEQQNEVHVENGEQYHVHEENGNTYSTDFYDPFYQRNYEMPTEASKMKRVNRPYLHSFHISSIPFVVGKSISPSHNIGLNIQQMLSIIKTRQPTMSGISPLLIRKVSRGIQPVETIFEQINKPYETTSYKNFPEGNRHQDIASYSYEQLQTNKLNSSMSNKNSHKHNFTCEPLYEEDEDCQSVYSESYYRNPISQGNVTCYEAQSRVNGGASTQLNACRQQSSQKQKRGQQLAEVPADDSFAGNYFSSVNGNKEITEVLVRLHDQYDKMIKQNDKLKERLEKDKGKDKTLAKEVSELEEALCAKDQEIKAVVNLFNEVRSLKEQMKLLEQRNSFVCIAREDPAFPTKTHVRARTAGPFLCDTRPRHNYFSRRPLIQHEPPHALRLTGLLRQIQAFQRQHSLA